jgi:hypothetical protein
MSEVSITAKWNFTNLTFRNSFKFVGTFKFNLKQTTKQAYLPACGLSEREVFGTNL